MSSSGYTSSGMATMTSVSRVPLGLELLRQQQVLLQQRKIPRNKLAEDQEAHRIKAEINRVRAWSRCARGQPWLLDPESLFLQLDGLQQEAEAWQPLRWHLGVPST